MPRPRSARSTATFDGYELHGLDAPAHYLRAGAGPPDLPEPVDLDQVERRMIRDCEGRPGAQAIWRNGRWWHTSLRPGRVVETLTEEPTGQVSRRVTTILVRGWEPPAPDWVGEPIPYHDCPDCTIPATPSSPNRSRSPPVAAPPAGCYWRRPGYRTRHRWPS